MNMTAKQIEVVATGNTDHGALTMALAHNRIIALTTKVDGFNGDTVALAIVHDGTRGMFQTVEGALFPITGNIHESIETAIEAAQAMAERGTLSPLLFV